MLTRLAHRAWPLPATLLASLLILTGSAGTVARAGAESCTALAQDPLPFPGPASLAAVPSAMSGAEPSSHVELNGGRFSYRYGVNSQDEVIRGMGYNPRYAGLDIDRRAMLYERDFAQMAGAGVNTVFGWNPAEFDGLTLDLAAAHGLGVALPYDIDYRLDFADPATRAAITAEVLDWVARYRWHPALRMWAIGNETLHKLVPPSWCAEGPLPQRRAAGRAFGSFYAELIDQVHAADPDHPVLYREAEDSYVEWMRAALAPGGQRPWFVYGLNVYTARLGAVLDAWPSHGLDATALVSEFAPPPEERPDGYRRYWATVRSHPRAVIGGAAYVWFADGPEEIDRAYGLIGSGGQPVDGALEIIRQIFGGETSAERWWAARG